jgi:[ribosomal protein S18]-alanine N-acetyltransferase
MTARALAALHAQCFTTPRPWNEAEFAELLQNQNCFLCQEDSGLLLGCVVAGEAELLTLAVLPQSRRQGIAQRLLQAFLTETLARHAESAFLEVAETNTAALNLYLKNGFLQLGRRKNYYRHPDGQMTDALVLVRKY